MCSSDLALILALTLSSWQLITFLFRSQKISRIQWLSPLLMLAAFPLHFLNQKWITGSYLEPTYSVFSRWHKLGFSPDVGILEPWGFNITQAIKNLTLVFLSLNDTLFGWPALGLLPVALAAWFFWTKRTAPHLERMLSFTFLLLCFWFGFYFVYFYPGICLGPRFHFPLFPFFIVISSYGILSLGRFRAAIGMLTLLSLWNCFQWQGRLRDSGGVLSDPMKTIRLIHNEVLDTSTIYVIKEDEDQLQDVTQRSLFSQFHRLNDPFDLQHPKFIKFSDFESHREWFIKKYGERFQILEFKEQNDG